MGIFFIIVASLGFYFEYRREKKLEITDKTEAVISNLGKGTYATVKYHVDNQELSSRLHCNCPELEVGDTILIRYSLQDPSTIALEKKFYMKKYKKY